MLIRSRFRLDVRYRDGSLRSRKGLDSEYRNGSLRVGDGQKRQDINEHR